MICLQKAITHTHTLIDYHKCMLRNMEFTAFIEFMPRICYRKEITKYFIVFLFARTISCFPSYLARLKEVQWSDMTGMKMIWHGS